MRMKAIPVLTGVALLVAAAAGTPTATAADLEQLRSRAQRLGESVSVLERDLAALNDTRDRLATEIAESSAEIGILEAGVKDAEDRYDQALARYVDRAIAAYKSGPSEDIALLLSTSTIDDFFTMVQVQSRAAAEDQEAIAALRSSREAAERVQEQIDERKQRLLAKSAEVEAVAGQIESRLDERRLALRELTDEVGRLEEQAAAAAAEAANPGAAFLDLLQPSGPAPGIPDGFAGTGVTFEGVASWYGPGFEGNPTASGDIFDPSLFTAASLDLPLGTWLYVTHGGRGVVVLVNDRGPYIDDRVLDLSQAAAEAIGISGLGWIEAEILVKAR
jgi:peptidoglycan hydrolase CwlO-like protein